MSAPATEATPNRRSTLPLWAGLLVCAVMLIDGDRLLQDPDTYWQIAVGQWIVDHRAVPWIDVYSFTMQGQPWMSSQWLSLAMYSQAYAWFGWPGLVVLATLAVALAYVLLARFLIRRLADVPVMILLPISFLMAQSHLYARPHVLALPVMVAWVAALLSAAERRGAPRPTVAALMTLWANLHGSFIFGLFLIVPIAFDAMLNAESSARMKLSLCWLVFGVVALAASVVTPYGLHTWSAVSAILGLGEALKPIREWMPLDFNAFGPVQVGILLIIALAFLKGVKLPLMRNVLFVGLLYMALAHVRNAEVFAVLVPMVLAAPLAAQFGGRDGGMTLIFPQARAVALSGAVLLTVAMVSFALAADRYRPGAWMTPVAAVNVLKDNQARRVFNDYNFGGYMISQGLAPYIDGRAELYGEKFVVEYNAARRLLRPAVLFDLLDRYGIDATLLNRDAPAARILDQVDGWRKVFIDDYVVVHVRDVDAHHNAEPEIKKPASN